MFEDQVEKKNRSLNKRYIYCPRNCTILNISGPRIRFISGTRNHHNCEVSAARICQEMAISGARNCQNGCNSFLAP